MPRLNPGRGPRCGGGSALELAICIDPLLFVAYGGKPMLLRGLGGPWVFDCLLHHAGQR